MADMTTIKGRIAETIYPNGTGAITAESHQALLLEMVDDINAKKADKEELTELSDEVDALQKIHETLDVTVEKLVTEKVDSMDYAPNLSVGTADNLAGVDVVASDFVFRRSGGGAISDGVARVESIKGNSVVWNQLYKPRKEELGTQVENGVTFIVSEDGIVQAEGTAEGASAERELCVYADFKSSHKYILIAIGAPEGKWSRQGLYFWGSNLGQMNTYTMIESEGYKIFQPQGEGKRAILTLTAWAGYSLSCKFRPIFCDLTQMFGAGNEPTTIEEFYARKPMGIEDENAYNEGEIIDMRAEGIKSVGVNQWDEQWELGNISGGDGGNIASDTLLRSKNYIPIMPCTKYYNNIAFGQGVFFYDDKKEFIIRKYNLSSIPQNARYMRFVAPSGYGTTYKNDICINLYDTEINGKYFPYTENAEDLSFIKDIFPNGMKSAGTAHDEIYYDKTTNKKFAVQRIKAVKMKDMNVKQTSNSLFYIVLDDMKLPTTDAERLNGILSNRYGISTSAGTSSMEDKSILRFNNNAVYFKDSAYADVASIKESFTDNDIFYYELAEPIVTEITADIVENPDFNLDYLVQNGGTEQMIATEPSSAIKADITYGFNAVGLIKQLRAMIEALSAKVANL